MRGHSRDDELRDFLTARTAELHRTAYLLSADQHRAEHLVESAIRDLRRDGLDLGQAESSTRHRMARMAAAVAIPAPPTDDTGDPVPAVAGLSPRERAVLMLRCLDGYDQSATARELGITRSKARAAEESAWQSLGFTTGDDTMHQALTDFAEQATWPDPERTLAASHRSQLPRRRSRKRYAAVAVVLALTAAAPIGSQIQHNSWLRTPSGINASHGTHFDAYTRGYKLVGVHHVPAGTTRRLKLPSDDVITLVCDNFSPAKESDLPVLRTVDTRGQWMCTKQSARNYFFASAHGKASVSAPRAKGHSVTIGVYQPVPWDRYPVAKNNFHVTRGKALDTDAKMNFDGPPVRRGKTLTMIGTNGVFTGTVDKPAAAKSTELFLSGLLSPTTTGQYKVTVGGVPISNCSDVDYDNEWCRIYDHRVPQVLLIPIFGPDNPQDAGSGPVSVRVEVRDALGPWKLQLRYDRYTPRN